MEIKIGKPTGMMRILILNFTLLLSGFSGNRKPSYFLCFWITIVFIAGCDFPESDTSEHSNYAFIDDNDTEEQIIHKAANIAPTFNQYNWQLLETTAFLHFTINTFTDKEWGDGTESPEIFNPTQLDTRQWVKVCKEAGLKMIIITAKHHDGFCLWPSKFTDHSIKNSPYKNGQGDIVKELSEACHEAGLKFGVYLSPWDRHEKTYGTDTYNTYFLNQLTELLSDYGRVDEVWFDGACGEGPNGKKQVYDWKSYYALIRKLQPDAVIAVAGPDVRWVGTESGYGRKTEWSVVPASNRNQEIIAGNSQQEMLDQGFKPMDMTDHDLGSREIISQANCLVWYPSEVDVSIRPGWFYHPSQDNQVKSAEKLVDIYYSSVGRNSLLLLNIPPDRRGLIHENDILALKKFRKILDATFDKNLLKDARISASGETRSHPIESIRDNDPDTYWSARKNESSAVIDIEFEQPQSFDVLLLQENIRTGQRIEAFKLECFIENNWKEIASGTTVGYKRLIRFPVIQAKRARLIIEQCRLNPTLTEMGLYKRPSKISLFREEPYFDDTMILRANEHVAAYAIPNIVTTPNGTVLCFTTARIGNNQDWGNVQEVAVIRSQDNGDSWEEPRIIAAIDNWTVRQTSAIVDPQRGKIMIFGHKSPRFNAEGERITETWKIENPDEMKKLGDGHFYLESNDDGISWSEMIDIDLPYWPHDPGIVLSTGKHKGRYILPARTNTGKEFDWNTMFNGVLYSDDKGKTWLAGGLTQSHVGEACVVELSDGRVYVNSRNHAENYGIRNHAISSDGGETFTEFGDDPQLIEPTCDAGMTGFTDPGKGHVILFSNPAVKATKRWDGTSRRFMSVKASFDEGKTWSLDKLVYEGPSAYSGIAVGKHGEIFLVYERAAAGSKDSRQHISIARFNLAWLEQKEIRPPVVLPEKSVFRERQMVRLTSPIDAEMYFTTDGSVPDTNSRLYSGPFILDRSTTVRAISSAENISSIVSTKTFIRSKMKAPVYLSEYSGKYPANGGLALVDGIQGSLNFNDGCWQGFEGNDMEVMVELPNGENTNMASVRFLQATDSWIFFPESVSFFTSIDGKNFTEIETIKNEESYKSKEESMQVFKVELENGNRNYVKIMAKNIGTCPDWHKGAGGKAWIFADEIIVE